jgi:formylglycine-generating enzyme required for sulfatase activity
MAWPSYAESVKREKEQKAALQHEPEKTTSSTNLVTTTQATHAAGQVFQDKLLGRRKGPEMVVIPAGSFEMGSNDGDSEDDEKFIHRVTINRPFALGKTEVTQGQWKAVMGSLTPELNFITCGDNCPVRYVSWDDIKDFIAQLNAKTGKTYRLPSEAEWEYACRAGGQYKYCGSDDVDQIAWHRLQKNSATPHPVAEKKPNDWGLYDMSGNVYEFVEDCYINSYSDAPTDGSARQGCGRYAGVVVRGGAWNTFESHSRATARGSYSPEDRSSLMGFRLVRTLP